MAQSMSLRDLKLRQTPQLQAPSPAPVQTQPVQRSLIARPESPNNTNPIAPIEDNFQPPTPGGKGGDSSSAQSQNVAILGMIVQLAAACWVAALYYPKFSGDWWDCRNWIVEGWKTPFGRMFLKVYLKHGLRAAEFLQAHPTARRAVRPLFVWANRKGKEM